MSSVVTTSENGLKLKIKRKSGKVVSDAEPAPSSQIASAFKQKFHLEVENNEKKRHEPVTKLSTKILQAGKNKGKNKKQCKQAKEKKIKKRISRVSSASNVGKSLSPSADRSPSESPDETNSGGTKLNGSNNLHGRICPEATKKESSSSVISSSSSSSSFSSSNEFENQSTLSTPRLSPDAKTPYCQNSKGTEEQPIRHLHMDKSTEVSRRDVETETSHVGIITDPDCLGPCEPGTSVVLEGIVWKESDNGILVVNVTWRGKTYVGTLMDSTRHHWAPPRFTEEDSAPAAQTSWGGGYRHHLKSRSEEATAAEVRKPRRCRKDASHHARLSKSIRSSNSLKDDDHFLLTPSELLQVKNKVDLFECQEEECSKKFKHIAGLRYHQSHAHCKKKDKMTSPDGGSSPLDKNFEKQPQQLSGNKTTEEISDQMTAISNSMDESEAANMPVSASVQSASSKFEEAAVKNDVDLMKPSSTKVSSSPLSEEPKNENTAINSFSSNHQVSHILDGSASDSKLSEKAVALQAASDTISSSPVPPLSRNEISDVKVEVKDIKTTPNESVNCDIKSDFIKESTSSIVSNFPKMIEVKSESSKKPNLIASSFSSSSSSSSSSASSFLDTSKQAGATNVKKHSSTPDFLPAPKKMKMGEEVRHPGEDAFYKAFRSMFENSPLPIDYFIDPFYRAQSLSMMSDPLLFHKNLLEPRGQMIKSSFDDMKPVDMSAKKTPSLKPEMPSFWPTYMPSSVSQSTSQFFGPLRDCGSDVVSRSLNENFSSSLPPLKDKSIPKLQRFGSSGRFHDPNRSPGSGVSREEMNPMRNYERDFNFKHKRLDDLANQKNGKLKEDSRKPALSSFSKQDVFRSPLPPPPLLSSSFPFFSSQHASSYSSSLSSSTSSRTPPHPIDSLDKLSSHSSRHQPSTGHSPTVGDRFKFPMEPPKQGTGGGAVGKTSLSSASSSGHKLHPEASPAPKHHLHTHHHTHIIKTPYPMYSQYAASLLTAPPIVPTVVVPEIFSPK